MSRRAKKAQTAAKGASALAVAQKQHELNGKPKAAVKSPPKLDGDVPENCRCPICWNGPSRGTGRRYAKVGRKRYYKCKACAHTWTVITKL